MKRTFTNRHVVLPVVHVEDTEQALRNADIVVEAGCDGFFLIHHAQDHSVLLDVYRAVRAVHPTAWIGLNCLDLLAEEVFAAVDPDVDGIWMDDAAIDERTSEQPMAERIAVARAASGWEGLYFGGVAFKGQRHVDDLETAAAVAARYMDVITTSGRGTGYAANVEKVRRIKTGAAAAPVGVASGITPDNVTEYLPHAQFFLVATGISWSFHELNPGKVRALIAAVRGFSTREATE
ncbi:MAG: BtpA/SgcQ family protein [Myxococcota bacterium]|jgi:hypothetical protein|nr:BtpA/SgcQ family protein [Myxococcota bacterium]